MSIQTAARPRAVTAEVLRRARGRYLSPLASLVLFVVMFTAVIARYDFASPTQVFLNLLGGQRLSDRARRRHDVRDPHRRHRSQRRRRWWRCPPSSSPPPCRPGGRCRWRSPSCWWSGPALGLLMGLVIEYFDVQPFIVTLAGMFLARGLCYVHQRRHAADQGSDPARVRAELRIPLRGQVHPLDGRDRARRRGDRRLRAAPDPFRPNGVRGRRQPAVGTADGARRRPGRGCRCTRSAGSARRWPGCCSPCRSCSGYSLNGIGLELDAIAAAVIGGVLLSGGVGFVLGSVIGVLVLGTIQTFVTAANLDSYWTRIMTGVLLLVFVLVQRLVVRKPG